jgi:predicted MPP superfamily phosphohydrolase
MFGIILTVLVTLMHSYVFWPFGYLVRLRYPLLEGRYEVDSMTIIVCRGTGTWGPRMRLWRPSEILRIMLHEKKRNGVDSEKSAEITGGSK